MSKGRVREPKAAAELAERRAGLATRPGYGVGLDHPQNGGSQPRGVMITSIAMIFVNDVLTFPASASPDRKVSMTSVTSNPPLKSRCMAVKLIRGRASPGRSNSLGLPRQPDPHRPPARAGKPHPCCRRHPQTSRHPDQLWHGKSGQRRVHRPCGRTRRDPLAAGELFRSRGP